MRLRYSVGFALGMLLAGGDLAQSQAPQAVVQDEAWEDEAPEAEVPRPAVRHASLALLDQAPQDPGPGDDLRKQLQLLRRQIEVLEKMIHVTAGQVEEQGPTLNELQTEVATLKARSKQAADRDQQLAAGVDNLTDHLDAQQRYGPQLPSYLKEMFLPSGTNETPLAIYGQMLERYHQFNGRAGQFESPAISPYFLLQLNNRFLLESNMDISPDGVDVPQVQMDWFISDSVTGVIGRYLTPIGFYNERLNHEWINKLPDSPLMFRQVSPLISTNGLQVRGSRYLFGSPVKIEYSLYGGNGAELGQAPANATQVADLSGITGGSGGQVDSKAVGGRLGLWAPARGVNCGISGYLNGPYAPGAKDHFQLYSIDASYHYGNWDARFEFAQNFQQAGAYIGHDIRRTGMYAQLAYRNYTHRSPFLQALEVVGRFSMARFTGIDPTQLDFTAFQSPLYAPVNRNQYTFGVNYYLYPSMICKVGYEVNQELGGINLNDNVFYSQYVWAF